MEKLLDYQLNLLKGGGHWREITPGVWIYVDDDEPDGDDVIFV